MLSRSRLYRRYPPSLFIKVVNVHLGLLMLNVITPLSASITFPINKQKITKKKKIQSQIAGVFQLYKADCQIASQFIKLVLNCIFKKNPSFFLFYVTVAILRVWEMLLPLANAFLLYFYVLEEKMCQIYSLVKSPSDSNISFDSTVYQISLCTK